MKAEDVTETLEQALNAPGLDCATVRPRPRLLPDNGSSCIATELSEWMEAHQMKHVRGAPYHPMTQGKIERWHQTLKNRVLLEHYRYHWYHESLSNLTPADVCFGRGEVVLRRRATIKRKTLEK